MHALPLPPGTASLRGRSLSLPGPSSEPSPTHAPMAGLQQEHAHAGAAGLPTLLRSGPRLSWKSMPEPPLSMPKSLPEAPCVAERVTCLAHVQRCAIANIRKHLLEVDKNCDTILRASGELAAVEGQLEMLGEAGTVLDTDHASESRAFSDAARSRHAPGVQGPVATCFADLRSSAVAHADSVCSMPPMPLPPPPPPAQRDATRYAATRAP